MLRCLGCGHVADVTHTKIAARLPAGMCCRFLGELEVYETGDGNSYLDRVPRQSAVKTEEVAP
jgi:hypothetical protein